MKKLLLLALLSTIFPLLKTSQVQQALAKKSVTVTMADSTIPNVPSYPMTISYLEAHPDKTPTILFIHGNSASKEFFTALMREPALRDYRLIAVDLPGHGESSNYPEALRKFFANPQHNDEIFTHHKHYYTFSGFAHILTTFFKTLKIDPKNLFLFGWSLGAKVAIDMVAETPAIQKAISTGTPIQTFATAVASFERLKKYPANKPGEQEMFPKGTTVLDLLSFRNKFTEEQALAFHGKGGVTKDDLPAEIITAAGTRTDPEARFFMINFAFSAADKQKQLGSYQDTHATVAQYHDKFVFVQGDRDPMRFNEEGQKHLKEIGVPFFYEIAGSGHAVFINKPAEVAAIITQQFTLPAASQACVKESCEKVSKEEKAKQAERATIAVTFRKATLDDIPTFLQFAQTIERDPIDSQSIILVPQHLRAADFGDAIQKDRFFVASDQEHRIVAILKLFLITTEKELNFIMKNHINNTDAYDANNIYLYTGTWYVTKQARGQGIIKRLFTYALESLRKDIDAFAKEHTSTKISLMAGVVKGNYDLIGIMEKLFCAFVAKQCKTTSACTDAKYRVGKPIFDEKADTVVVSRSDTTVEAYGHILTTAWC